MIDDDSDSEENIDSETSSKSSASSHKKDMCQIDYTDKCTDAMTLAFDKKDQMIRDGY